MTNELYLSENQAITSIELFNLFLENAPASIAIFRFVKSPTGARSSGFFDFIKIKEGFGLKNICLNYISILLNIL